MLKNTRLLHSASIPTVLKIRFNLNKYVSTTLVTVNVTVVIVNVIGSCWLGTSRITFRLDCKI